MTNGVSIRIASDKEIIELQALLSADPDKSIGVVLRNVESVGENVFIIESSGRPAGFITYRAAADEIFPIFVFTPFRRQGVGLEAMRQLIALLQSEQRHDVFIEIISKDAAKFWSSVFKDYPNKEYESGKYSIDITPKYREDQLKS